MSLQLSPQTPDIREHHRKFSSTCAALRCLSLIPCLLSFVFRIQENRFLIFDCLCNFVFFCRVVATANPLPLLTSWTYGVTKNRTLLGASSYDDAVRSSCLMHAWPFCSSLSFWLEFLANLCVSAFLSLAPSVGLSRNQQATSLRGSWWKTTPSCRSTA